VIVTEERDEKSEQQQKSDDVHLNLLVVVLDLRGANRIGFKRRYDQDATTPRIRP
jgi:hypothetical protein